MKLNDQTNIESIPHLVDHLEINFTVDGDDYSPYVEAQNFTLDTVEHHFDEKGYDALARAFLADFAEKMRTYSPSELADEFKHYDEILPLIGEVIAQHAIKKHAGEASEYAIEQAEDWNDNNQCHETLTEIGNYYAQPLRRIYS